MFFLKIFENIKKSCIFAVRIDTIGTMRDVQEVKTV